MAVQEAQDDISRGSASEAQMRSVISRTMERITGKGLSSVTIRGWFNRWIAAKEGAITDHTYGKYKQAVAKFLEFLGPRADGRMGSIQQQDIIDFRNSLRAKGVSPTTINHLVSKIISAPLRTAFHQGIIDHNPAAGLQRLIDRAKKRKSPFSIDEVRRLLDVAPGEWRGVILCGYSTGMRLGDVAGLKWSDIDFVDGIISFEQKKTGQATAVGLHPDFRGWLNAQSTKEGHVFPSMIGRVSSGKSGLSSQFAAIMRKAGVDSAVIREGKGKGRRVFEKSFHSFRHGAASAVFKSKVIEAAQRAVTGHTRGQTLKTYTHHDLDVIKAASSLIPRI